MKKSASNIHVHGQSKTAQTFFQAKMKGDFFNGTSNVQAKLRVGQPNDKYEREADQVADQVVGQPTPERSSYPQITPLVSDHLKPQRAEEETTQNKEEEAQLEVEDVQEMAEKDIAQNEEEETQATSEENTQLEEDVQEMADEESAQSKEEEAQAEAEDDTQLQEEVQEMADEESLQNLEEEAQSATEEDAQRQEEIQEMAEKEAQSQEEDTQMEAEEVQELADDDAAQNKAAIQTKSVTKQEQTADELIAKLQATKGQGSQLKDGLQLSMEEGFGVDFSGVRIHTNSAAVQLSKALRAKAFTNGKDIYFNEGQFAPDSLAGKRLIAHELTHTIQQGAVKARSLLGKINDPFGLLQSKEEDNVQAAAEDGDKISVRPEVIAAINLARTQVGKVNSKLVDAQGNRTGWKHLKEYFDTAFGGENPIHESVIKKLLKTKDGKEMLPSWCGLFVWWAFKKSGIPMPDWRIGVNILKGFKTRGLRELPQKGDIAYNQRLNNHYGFVTGVESAASAKGKPYMSILVTTMNGNTAGGDNLGGQIQEQTHTIGHWLQDQDGESVMGSCFINPFSGLSMPPVEMVETTREASQEVASTDTEPEVAEETKRTEKDIERIAGLDGEVLSEASVMPKGTTDINLELPPQPDPGPAEKVAEVEQTDLSGKSDEALVEFTKGSASSIAITQPKLGASLNDKLSSEKQEEANDAPVLVAKTSNKVEEGFTLPNEIPMPNAKIGDGKMEADPGDKQADPHIDNSLAPSTKQFDKTLNDNEKKQGGGFFDWLKKNMSNLLYQIPVSDNNIKTSAGPAQKVDLSGDTNPEKMNSQRADAETGLKNQRDSTTEALKNHPGQKNIQPKEVNEEKPVALSLETTVEIQTPEDLGMSDYASAPMPADVRNKSDQLMKPTLETSLAETKTKTEEAASQKETNKESEVQKAKDKVDASNQKADEDQKNIVVENRNKVAEEQKQGIADAYTEIDNFNTEADGKQNEAKKAIKTEIDEKEAGAKKELEKGEEKAKGIKEKGEKDAKIKKAELKKKQENQSWWDKVKSAVKSAVKVLTDAIGKVFTWVREGVTAAINAAKDLAVGLINKARTFIKDKLEKFRTWAKDMTNKYLKDTFPGLAARINNGIDAFVDTAKAGVDMVADAAVAAVEFIADNLTKALNKILQVFETALKAAVQIAGALLTGDFAEALRIAIQAACDIAGINSQIIFDFIDRVKAQIMKILKDPGTFFKNLVTAVGGGVNKFFDNIVKHLQTGLIGWLTGSLSETGLTLPDKFDFMGIVNIVLQVLGLTYENIKAKVIKRLPGAEKVFAGIEKGVEIVKKIATVGIKGIWAEVKQEVGNFKEMIMGGIKDFVMKTVIQEGVIWLLSLLNPASAIVKALKLVVDFIIFLKNNFQRIIGFVKSVYESLANIAAGNIGPAIKYIAATMARILPIMISLLANLAGLRGIAKAVKNTIKKVSAPINKVIKNIVNKMVAKGRALLGKGKKVAKKVKGKLVKWWTAKKKFKGKDGENHKLYFKGSGKSTKLMVASKKQTFEAFIRSIDVEDGKKVTKNKAIAIAEKIDEIKKEKTGAPTKKETAKKKEKKKKKLQTKLEELSPFTAELFGMKGSLPKSEISYSTVSLGGGVMGKKMKAKVLTKEGTKGSPPNGTHPAFTDLLARREGGRSYYIRGHLLNDNIHGPGKWKNMTILSQKGNKNHLNTAEEPVKKAVLSGAVVQYNVEAVYNRGDLSVDDNKLKSAGIVSEKWGLIKKIRIAEKFVPSGLTLNATLLAQNEKGNFVAQKTLVPDGSAINTIDTNLQNYEVGEGKAKENVSITNNSAEKIAKNTTLSFGRVSMLQKQAQSIVSLKHYNQIIEKIKSDDNISLARKKLLERGVETLRTAKNVKL